MPIITITSDFGQKDFYLAAIKGSLLSENDLLPIVDITHNIENHDIVQAAFIFKNAWSHFPPGTIHLISVKNFYSKEPRFIVFKFKDHFFIGPDNGIFSLVFDSLDGINIFTVPFSVNQNSFSLIQIFTSTIKHIIGSEQLDSIGPPIDEITQRITFQPVITNSEIRGSVIHIDNYDNAIVNISQALFNKVGQGRSFELYFKRHDPITKMCKRYNDVPVGESLCLFNQAGLLEIAINMGKASSLLGLKIEDTIQITFQ